MKIKVKEFEHFVQHNAKRPIKGKDDPYSFIGLAGECGEVMEWLKKSVYRGDKRFAENDLKLELGDVIHYVARIGIAYGWTLKDIMAANVEKLNARQ